MRARRLQVRVPSAHEDDLTVVNRVAAGPRAESAAMAVKIFSFDAGASGTSA
jgi:hypothetical protein